MSRLHSSYVLSFGTSALRRSSFLPLLPFASSFLSSPYNSASPSSLAFSFSTPSSSSFNTSSSSSSTPSPSSSPLPPSPIWHPSPSVVLGSNCDPTAPSFLETYRTTTHLLRRLHRLFISIATGEGSSAVHRHRQRGKMLPRERIDRVLDPGSPFLELSPFAGYGMYDKDEVRPGGTSVSGIGIVGGGLVAVFANDATSKGGVYFPITVKKHLRLQEIAEKLQIPCLYLVDSGGAMLTHQADVFPDRDHFGRIFRNESRMSRHGTSPQIAAVLGSCTAGGAYVPVMAEEAVVVRKNGSVFLAGPPLVQAATGEVIGTDALGGAEVLCAASGVADHYAQDEIHALQTTREILKTIASQRAAFFPPSYLSSSSSPFLESPSLSSSPSTPSPSSSFGPRTSAWTAKTTTLWPPGAGEDEEGGEGGGGLSAYGALGNLDPDSPLFPSEELRGLGLLPLVKDLHGDARGEKGDDTNDDDDDDDDGDGDGNGDGNGNIKKGKDKDKQKSKTKIQTKSMNHSAVFSSPSSKSLSSQQSTSKRHAMVGTINARAILARILDGSRFQEFKENYGRTIVTGFGSMYGIPIGVVANHGGVIFPAAARKAAHFVSICTTRRTPLLFLHDVSGFVVGGAAEREGVAKDGAKLVAAVAAANVPKISLVVGGSYGAGNYAMNGRAYDPDFMFTWPAARVAVMGGAQAAEVLSQVSAGKMKGVGNSKEEGGEDDRKKEEYRREIRRNFEKEEMALYGTARLWDDGIIDPVDTRRIVGLALGAAVWNRDPKSVDSPMGIWRM